MQQLDLITSAPTAAPMPIDIGKAAALACADKAERTTQFNSEAARAFVLEHLASNGACWGEDIVAAAVATGRAALQAHDGRAYGSVLGTLAKRGQIVCLRADGVRKLGHGTSGARLWALGAQS